MSKRAFLVLGPESSGTRWITRWLLHAGCVGSDDHEQPWDHALPTDEPLIVWRRSFPHGDYWPCMPLLVNGLRGMGYDVTALVVVRDWFAMSCSQGQFQPAEEIEGHIQDAYRRIFTGLNDTDTPFIVVSYEAALLGLERFVNMLLHHLGLEATLTDCGAVNGNAKWYKDANG